MIRPTCLLVLAACNMGPRVDDLQIDAPPTAPPDAPESYLLPADAVVPSLATNSELVTQIQFNDGLVDATLMMNGGVVVRGTGKSGGATVRFWNFGPSPFDSFSVLAPIYYVGTLDGANVFTPLPDHPPLLDTIPGDLRYSPIRRVLNVPVTDAYDGEKITSLAALNEAIDRGLVGDPIVEGTWINLPVVPPGTMLEVGGGMPPMPAKQVYARGYLVDAFELGTSLGRQPLRLGIVNVLQASLLQSGVATGSPPVKPTTPDAQPVFQAVIPTAPPTTTQTYSPLVNDVTVRLADGVAPSEITSDTELFTRTAAGAITGYRADHVESFVVGTIVNNLQLQFAEGAP